MKSLERYFLDILISIDQLVNTVFAGSPDHTISGRVGYYSLVGKRWANVLEKGIDTLFFWDTYHCYNSIEWHIVERDGIYKPYHNIDLSRYKTNLDMVDK